jgi:glucosamine--fructose-6-phosphate aminotransferase (isomerizing)
MLNEYTNDLMAQPQAVRDTLASLADAPTLSAYAQRLRSGGYTRLVLTGMGASYHALHPLWLALVAQRLPAIHIETSELIHAAPALLDAGTLVIAVSQSGRSAEILHLLELPHAALLAVTNTPSSPLAVQASAVLLTQAGEESTVSCKTYVAALAALALLGKTLLGEDPRSLLAELTPVPAAMQRYLEQQDEHVTQLSHLLHDKQLLFLAGRGPSLAAAGTGALIIKEAAHFPAEGMSSAALRHGPLNMITPSLFTLVFAGTGTGTQPALNEALVADIRLAGGQAALVGGSQPAGPFCLPDVSPAALPLLEILPAQMLSLACAQITGWPPGTFRHTSKVTAVE